MVKRGLIHIYTGDGKGKTTAALGAALRAQGNGLKVGWICFHKNPQQQSYGEFCVLKKIGIAVFGGARHHPLMDKASAEEVRRECGKGIQLVRKLFHEENYDMLVLDEIIVSAAHGLLKEKELMFLLKEKPVPLELILTGRGAPSNLAALADYVNYIGKVKHPYDKGIKARKGIEF